MSNKENRGSVFFSVTGSNTGIGKMTAIDLAKRGARVILACRSRQRGEAALADVKRVCPNEQFNCCDSLWCHFNLNKTVVAYPCLLLSCLVSRRRAAATRWSSCSWIWGV